MEEIEMNQEKDSFNQTNITNAWYRKYPNLLLAGNVGTGKSKEFLYGMVYKLLARTEEENLYICDGKRMMSYTSYVRII